MANYVMKDGKKVYRRFKRLNGRLVTMARWAYSIHHGDIPIGFDVHHKNGCPLDDRIENLELVPHGMHTVNHHSRRSKYTPGELVSENGKIKASYHHKWYLKNQEKRRADSLKYYYTKKAKG